MHGKTCFRFKKPASSIKALRAMVHDGVTSDEALKISRVIKCRFGWIAPNKGTLSPRK